jgi:Rrf2 family iron-sulfur cluster assembly transcriptional regulator
MLSKKSINAINAVIWLGFLQTNGPVSLHKISESLSLSISCLEQIFAHLKGAHLIQSFKGPGGGYFLSKGLHEITLWQVAQTFERAGSAVGTQTESVPTHDFAICQETLFSDFQRVSESFLSEMTLQEAIDLCMAGHVNDFITHDERHNRFKLKPLAAPKLPNGPNSIFNWAAMAF